MGKIYVDMRKKLWEVNRVYRVRCEYKKCKVLELKNICVSKTPVF
jgi:hypothetical protein